MSVSFPSFCAVVAIVTALLGSRRFGWGFTLFRGALVLIHTSLSVYLYHRLPHLRPALWVLAVIAYTSLVEVVPRSKRGAVYHTLISIPAAFYLSATFLALPWGLLAAAGLQLPLAELPLLLAAVGTVQSLWTRPELIDISIRDGVVPGLSRTRGTSVRVDRPLRIIQLTDTHLGPFMSASRLRRICERAVSASPDLILLTGDFLTIDSQSDPEPLRHALEPLRALPGRVFSCVGNHDYEAPDIVQGALAHAGARLLVDDQASVETEAGPVQVLGADFRWRDRSAHLKELTERFPRHPGALRVVLLHDPGAFRHLPEGEGDLVLSGHTHGGQVGLVSLGLDFTMLRIFAKNLPDHGFWGRGRDRLYVHRGTGHYGFPLRIGVPAEDSILHVHYHRVSLPEPS